MISTESKFYTSKNSISESLQIRTNKHRCFVFCIGHTSLTCVPGIGKKNKYLLNQSGIHDLTTLYSKYRSINNIENFKQWLENDIGFTSYQAKMTTCGLSTKLGKIQELDKGLIPICCSTKERREEKYKLLFHNKNINKRIHNMKLINEKNKKLKIEKNKSESLLTNSSYDQTESLKLFNTLMQEETSLLSHEVSFGEKFKAKEILETKLMKFNSSSMIHETTNVNIDSTQSTIQNSSSLDMNNIQNIDSNETTTSHEFPKINLLSDSEHSKQLEINQIHNNIDKTLSTIESSNISELQQSKDNRDQQMKINYSKEITTNSIPQEFDSISSSELPIENKAQSKREKELPLMNIDMLISYKSSIDNKIPIAMIDDQTKIHPCSIFVSNDLQEKKNESVSSSQTSPNSSIGNNFPRKSILRSTQSKSIHQLNTNILLASIKQKQKEAQIQNKSLQIIESSTIDSNKKFQANEISLNRIHDKSISAIKQSYALLPISTPAIFPIRPKSNTSKSIKLSSDNNLTPKIDEYSQDYVVNQSDSSLNKSQQNQFQEQIEKIVRRIMKQATHIVSEVLQTSQANTISFTKTNSIESSSIQMPIFEMKNSNDKAQSIILSQRQDDQHRTTPSKCIPLAEQLAQTGSKKLTTTLESNTSLSSSSMQSIHNINSFIDKVQTNSTDKNYFEKETNSIIKHDYVLLNTSTSKNKFESISTSNLNQISDFTTEISMNRISTEHHKQTSLLTTTLFNDNKKYKLNTTTMIPFYHLNQLPISQKIKDNEFINKNLSEIITENEILDRIFNPSTPKSCYPIWNNISNEKLLSQHKNNHLILIEKDKFSKENNHNDHNQNYHSSTTLFTFITRQQYAKEQQTLNEHILYVKQTKPLYKSS
ncbi:unnamed protein product [Rotaria sp. Silwood1]|nr:unnamed protein product [Rotaria sp. Silwood1]